MLCADGEQRDAYIVAMVAPKRGARVDPRTAAEARKACWRTYAAHRELSCSNGLCKAYGWLEEQPLPERQRVRDTDEDAPPGASSPARETQHPIPLRHGAFSRPFIRFGFFGVPSRTRALHAKQARSGVGV